ncbi:hypothetical protein BN159_3591 [Streptomyces davaonensis JCM 4913]|uniref:Serine/arginine repetitive matrix protein 2 n=1 Tax=Streptomyces davaonensis (strain DSM 101723 / JCM 4913 / KCC S-0913 / 768) TaxID=1214101 RepID=K4R4H7_STRDJ|nr:hypothetical protein [Streptomyces davaonensis]CCK27970.1 hypothetical protein BN159_3591 [Streptomyces davaonensis JCM 4913]
MSGWGHEPSEERGQAPWSARRPDGTVPPWSTAETQTYGGHRPAPAPAPEPPRAHRPRRLVLALLAAVVLGVGAGAGAWVLIREDDGGSAGATDLTVTTAPPSGTSTSPPSGTATTAPGYRRAQDPVGYTLLVPEDWIRRQKAGEEAPVVFYDAPDDGRRLQIFRIAEPTVEESLAQAETAPGYGFASRTGYRALARDSGPGFAELTYRYDDEDKGPRLVVDHRFEAADGTPYAIRASGPEELAPERIRAPLTTALGSFCPSGGDCG